MGHANKTESCQICGAVIGPFHVYSTGTKMMAKHLKTHGVAAEPYIAQYSDDTIRWLKEAGVL
jgi:hypothetical protein